MMRFLAYSVIYLPGMLRLISGFLVSKKHTNGSNSFELLRGREIFFRLDFGGIARQGS
jgi:hypothetical protein